MDIIGKWKVARGMGMDGDDNRVWLTEEEFKKSPAYDPDDPDSASAYKTAYIFNEDHTVNSLVPIPDGVSQSEIDEAVASGEVKIVDGMLLMKDKDPIEWKEEGGKLFINFKDSDGDSWTETTIEDGLMDFLFFKLEKM